MPVESAGVQPGRVYLDYAGFAPVDPRVLAVMRPFLEAGIGNPSARHSLGAEARESLDAARGEVARICGAPGGIVFTPEPRGKQLATRAVVRQRRGGGRSDLLRHRAHHGDQAPPRLEKDGVTSVLPVDAGPSWSRCGAASHRGTVIVRSLPQSEIGTVADQGNRGRVPTRRVP